MLTRGDPKDLICGDYMIWDKVADGLRSEIFLAQHRQTKEWVAIKMFPEKFITAEPAVKKFHEDLAAATPIRHENLAGVIGSGIKDDRLYVISEFVEATDVSWQIKQYGPLPHATAIDYVCQAAAGLSCAHQNRLVHLNLKPSQLMVDDQGLIKVTDLGLARFTPPVPKPQSQPADRSATRTGLMPAADFVAPERAYEPRAVDSRADVYGLGALLFYLLTGQPMYRKGSPEATIRAHGQEPIPKLAEYASGLPPGLQNVFAKAVAKRPQNRYRTIDEFVTELDAAAQEPATSALEANPSSMGMPGGSGDSLEWPPEPSSGTGSQAGASIPGFEDPNAAKKQKEKEKEEKEALQHPAVQFGLAALIIFSVMFLFCFFAQDHYEISFRLGYSALQATVAALLSGTVWFFRGPVLEYSRNYGWAIGLGAGFAWGLLYWNLDYPYATDIGNKVSWVAALARQNIHPMASVLLVGVVFGLFFGLTGERGSFFMALGLFYPVIAVA
ncbi:MAG: serine/threonine protein kinase, partial [Planctomycetales bacterium]